jgi:hypothetical protein
MELILALASLPYVAKVRFAAVSLIWLMTGRGRSLPVGVSVELVCLIDPCEPGDSVVMMYAVNRQLG